MPTGYHVGRGVQDRHWSLIFSHLICKAVTASFPCNMCAKAFANRSEVIVYQNPRSAQGKTIYRCIECMGTNRKMRILFEENHELQLGFKGLDKVDKESFADSARGLLGADLKTLLYEKCGLTAEQTQERDETGVAEWLDEDDLKDKYKNKPHVAVNIMNNSKNTDNGNGKHTHTHTHTRYV